MNELLLVVAMIIIGVLASFNEATYRAMVMVALLCIYYQIPRR
jgi:hypothetical protein